MNSAIIMSVHKIPTWRTDSIPKKLYFSLVSRIELFLGHDTGLSVD